MNDILHGILKDIMEAMSESARPADAEMWAKIKDKYKVAPDDVIVLPKWLKKKMRFRYVPEWVRFSGVLAENEAYVFKNLMLAIQG